MRQVRQASICVSVLPCRQPCTSSCGQTAFSLSRLRPMRRCRVSSALSSFEWVRATVAQQSSR